MVLLISGYPNHTSGLSITWLNREFQHWHRQQAPLCLRTRESSDIRAHARTAAEVEYLDVHYLRRLLTLQSAVDESSIIIHNSGCIRCLGCLLPCSAPRGPAGFVKCFPLGNRFPSLTLRPRNQGVTTSPGRPIVLHGSSFNSFLWKRPPGEAPIVLHGNGQGWFTGQTRRPAG